MTKAREWPNQFEWWYLHILCEQIAITITLHVTDLLGGRMEKPYLSVSCYARDSRFITERRVFVLTPTRGHERRLFADGMLIETDSGYQVDLSMTGLLIVANIARRTGPWEPRSLKLATDPDSGRASYWSVALPIGDVDGYLMVDGQDTIRLAGYAYQDHNWGSLPLYETFKTWGWMALARAASNFVGASLMRHTGSLQLYVSTDGAFRQRALPPTVGAAGRKPSSLATLSVIENLSRWLSKSQRIQIMKLRRYGLCPSTSAVYRRWAVVEEGASGRIQGIMETCNMKGPCNASAE